MNIRDIRKTSHPIACSKSFHLSYGGGSFIKSSTNSKYVPNKMSARDFKNIKDLKNLKDNLK